ncbi:MAG: polysaccharide biosynthesis tyrosine autokinase [Lachnospiraceae bacterium]|nr:polysaccharide biosynthesis tyrosine autokinase [Lachnospiraceae bacterium]
MNEWFEYIDNNRCVIHIGELCKLLLKNIWIIILATLVLGGGAYAYSTFCITPLYQSSIKMYVNNSVNTADSTSITSSDITASQNLVDTYAVVLTSYPTLSAVIEQTGVSYSYEQLSAMISTSAIDETEVFRVTVTSSDAAEAAMLANAIADIAPEQIMEIVTGSSVKVVEYARIETSKSSPHRSRYALMGAMAGFVLSCGGIMLLSLLRNGMSVEEKIRRDFKNKAILSVIPLMGDDEKEKGGRKGKKKKSGKSKRSKKKMSEYEAELCAELSFASSEAYKLLRENITFCFSDKKECRIVGVTSSMRSEGKTTTAINLAYTLALANKKVCLIDCDFRLPSIAKRLNLKKKPGMTNFLVGQSYGENVMQPYSTSQANFIIIAAGDVPPNPSELLGSVHMQEVLEIISKSFDYIILDLPPVGIVSDALTVTKLLDGMLFVVREDYYDRRLLSESMRTLEGVDTKLIGMVVTRSTSQKKEYRRYNYKYGYQYGYDYGYGYGSTEKAAQAAAVSDADADTDPGTSGFGTGISGQGTAEFGAGTTGRAAAVLGAGTSGQDTAEHGAGTSGQTTEASSAGTSFTSDGDVGADSDEKVGRYEALK